jgi:hypothetical protein
MKNATQRDQSASRYPFITYPGEIYQRAVASIFHSLAVTFPLLKISSACLRRLHRIVAFRDVRRDGCSGGFLQHPDDSKMRALSVSAHPNIRDGTLHHNREKEKV